MSRRIDKLEQNVERSRERLSATLDELRLRMQPSTLRQEGSAYLTNTGAGQFVTNLKADALGNPVPLALLGIAVAWLASADRSSQPPVSIGRYTIMARWWARRLTQSAQKNASKTLSTVQTTRSAAGELQQRAREVSRNLSDQLSRAPDQVRGVAQRLARSTTTRANAISDVTRRHPLLVGTAAAGLAVSAVGLTLLYRRYAGELDAASRLVEASEEEAHSEALTSVPEATLVPHDFPNALEDLPVTAGAGQ